MHHNRTKVRKTKDGREALGGFRGSDQETRVCECGSQRKEGGWRVWGVREAGMRNACPGRAKLFCHAPGRAGIGSWQKHIECSGSESVVKPLPLPPTPLLLLLLLLLLLHSLPSLPASPPALSSQPSHSPPPHVHFSSHHSHLRYILRTDSVPRRPRRHSAVIATLPHAAIRQKTTREPPHHSSSAALPPLPVPARSPFLPLISVSATLSLCCLPFIN
ncbi:hypothetical protein E2C01_066494 [Portunus trituberculatus]|uniref:Uncharacterized protein n=1 Tax=Portunus trituberculatus TaxID=210409 RepID=A0A5B7HSG6_PORTR|nr:hypothetical protein [Portunus trituberculatus]